MKKSTQIIGLVGAILTIVGVFLPWSSSTTSASGWQLAELAPLFGASLPQPYLLMIGGIVVFLGMLLVMLTGTRAPVYLAISGGTMLAAAGLWTGAVANMSAAGYGFWVTISGVVISIVTVIINTFTGFKKYDAAFPIQQSPLNAFPLESPDGKQDFSEHTGGGKSMLIGAIVVFATVFAVIGVYFFSGAGGAGGVGSGLYISTPSLKVMSCTAGVSH